MMRNPPLIRDVRPSDVSALVDIEREVGPSTWSTKAFIDELSVVGGRQILLEEMDDRDSENAASVLAFYISREVPGSVELLNIAVASDARRRGLGRLLLENLISYSIERGVESLLLEVRASNHPAITLYKSSGFVEVGRRKGYYSQQGEDALLMTLSLGRYYE